MAPKIEMTSDLSAKKIKLYVYGDGGSGKTTAIRTCPNPLLLASENGCLSLQAEKIPYVKITSWLEFSQIITWFLESAEANKYDTLAVDSISELFDMCWNKHLKAKNGSIQFATLPFIDEVSSDLKKLQFQDKKHIYATFRISNDKPKNAGRQVGGDKDVGQFVPQAPLTRASNLIRHIPDAVFYAFLDTVYDGDKKDVQAYWVTEEYQNYYAKNRLMCLDLFEPQDFNALVEKILRKKP